MCLLIFIAADHPLPIIHWHKDKGDFHVITVLEKEKSVAKHFSKTHIRYVGSKDGCGCLFNIGREYPDFEYETEELSIAEHHREILVTYLKSYNVQEIFMCEEGKHDSPPTFSRKIKAEDIFKDEFVFIKSELLTLINDH